MKDLCESISEWAKEHGRGDRLHVLKDSGEIKPSRRRVVNGYRRRRSRVDSMVQKSTNRK